MTRSIAYCTLIVAVGLAIVLSVYSPSLMSDENDFLRQFVGNEFLSVLGVILAITLASAAQLHLTLNQIEERYSQPGGMNKTRAGVHNAAHWLIVLFGIGLLIVLIKPLMATEKWQQSLFNCSAIIIILWNILILISITRAVFRVKPLIDNE